MPKKRKKTITDIDRVLSWCSFCGKGLSDRDIRKGYRKCKRCRRAEGIKKLGRFA